MGPGLQDDNLDTVGAVSLRSGAREWYALHLFVSRLQARRIASLRVSVALYSKP